MVLNALDLLLAEPVLRVEGPSTITTAVNEQKEHKRLADLQAAKRQQEMT